MLLKSLLINATDNVAVLLENATRGDQIETSYGSVTLLEDVEFAHKVLLIDLPAGAPVIKYGAQIGYTLAALPKGSWIHNHNMGCDRGK